MTLMSKVQSLPGRRIRLDRFHRFLCGSALLVAAVAVTCGWVIGEFFERHALRQQAEQTGSFVRHEARRQLSPAVFSTGPSADATQTFARFMRELPGVFRIKVFDGDGRIVWSDEPELIGRTFPDHVGLRRALGGGVTTWLGRPRRSEHEFERDHRWVAEAYVPIAYPGHGVVGVIETYKDAAGLVADIARAQRRVWAVAAGAGLLLWGGLASLAWRTNVAERRAIASVERAQAEEKFRLAVEAAPNAMVMAQEDGRIVLANAQAERLFGYAPEEFIGRSVETLVPLPSRSAHGARRATFFDRFTARRMGVDRELHGVTKDGALVPVEIGLNPIVSHGQRLVLASIVDITERRRTELERAELLARSETARLEAERANRAKDDFLAMLGHELRNPLGAIRTAMHVHDAVAADDARAVQARGVVRRQVQHLSQLVDDLLDVARLTSGKIVLGCRPVNLAETVRHTLDAATADERAADRVLRVSTVDAWVAGDPTRLYQVVTNLVANAVKYTPAGGTIAIDVRRGDDAAILTVSDTGAGISASLLPHVFEPFRQGERTLDRSEGGLGIGLTVVRKLVEAHGGTVSVSSDGPGRGSTFVVRLPLLEAPQGRERPPGTPAADGARRRVLVVEDNDDAREMLKAVVELGGHVVQTAEDGLRAVEMAEAWKPDVALVDIGLPGIDGYEVARRLRAQSGRPRLIAITGYGQHHDRRRAAEAGFDLHFVKPVDPGRLLGALAGE